MRKKGALALSQIFILVVGIVAISYALGSSVGVVSGLTEADCIQACQAQKYSPSGSSKYSSGECKTSPTYESPCSLKYISGRCPAEAVTGNKQFCCCTGAIADKTPGEMAKEANDKCYTECVAQKNMPGECNPFCNTKTEIGLGGCIYDQGDCCCYKGLADPEVVDTTVDTNPVIGGATTTYEECVVGTTVIVKRGTIDATWRYTRTEGFPWKCISGDSCDRLSKKDWKSLCGMYSFEIVSTVGKCLNGVFRCKIAGGGSDLFRAGAVADPFIIQLLKLSLPLPSDPPKEEPKPGETTSEQTEGTTPKQATDCTNACSNKAGYKAGQCQPSGCPGQKNVGTFDGDYPCGKKSMCCCQKEDAPDASRFSFPGSGGDVWSLLKEPLKMTDGTTVNKIRTDGTNVFAEIDGVSTALTDVEIAQLTENGILTKNLITDDLMLNLDKVNVETTDYFGFLEVPVGGFFDIVLGGALWGAAVFGAIQLIGPILGLDKELVEAASWALGIGVGMGKAAATWIGGAAGTGVGIGIGIGVSLVLLAFMYRKENIEVISFSCQPWGAAIGGDNCEKCNEQGILPCSEYQCRSLGQACELIDKGTDEEKCVWVDRNDVDFPTIEALPDALLAEHKYVKQNTGIMPPDTGVKIVNKTGDECIKAFTPF